MLVAVLLALPCVGLPQQDETVRDFKRYFRKAKETADRVEYVKALEGIDDPTVAKLLLPVLTDKDPQVAAAALEVVAALPSPKSRASLLPVVVKGKPSSALPFVVRAAGRGHWLEFTPSLRPWLEGREDRLRLWTATALAELGDTESLPGLAERAEEDGNPLVRVAAVDAIAVLGKGHEDLAGPALVSALDDPALEVQTAACLALHRVRVREAIGPLVRMMNESEGRILEEVYPALLALTDLQYGDNPETWRKWWARAQDDYVLPTDAEIAARRAARKQANAVYRPSRKAASFVGVDTPSRRIVFVIDVSGSMEEFVHDREAFAERGMKLFGKLDIVKAELLQAIQGMDSHVRFNILAFASQVHPWRSKLAPANSLNRKSAMEWVKKLQPVGGALASERANVGLKGSSGVEDGRTNTYAALCAALGVSDLKKGLAVTVGPGEKVDSDVDTIFFLSDGRPSVGRLTDTDDIRQAIDELNRYRRVTIHTIAIGDFQKDFMQMLAEENGGSFVDLGR